MSFYFAAPTSHSYTHANGDINKNMEYENFVGLGNLIFVVNLLSEITNWSKKRGVREYEGQ